jgi:hypothetical protein
VVVVDGSSCGAKNSTPCDGVASAASTDLHHCAVPCVGCARGRSHKDRYVPTVSLNIFEKKCQDYELTFESTLICK